MSDVTTTPDADVAQAPVVPDATTQPDAIQSDEAVQSTDEPNNDSPAPEEPAANPTDNSDDDFSGYWSKKGIDISTPEGQAKAAKSYQEAEKAMHRKGQEASQLSKQLTTQPVEVDSDNPLVQELASKVVTLERKQNIANFADEVKLTAAQESTMAQYLADNPTKVQLVNGGYMTLQEVYSLSGAASPDPAALKREGGQAALQELADKQRATAPSGSATHSSGSASDDSIDGLKAKLKGVTF